MLGRYSAKTRKDEYTMKNLLTRNKLKIWWFDNKGSLHDDNSLPSYLRGDVSGLSGNVSYLRGDVTGISGNVSYLRGDVTGISGNVSNLRGDLDDCEISNEEREIGVNIQDLVSSK
jgi:hypothetical protein